MRLEEVIDAGREGIVPSQNFPQEVHEGVKYFYTKCT